MVDVHLAGLQAVAEISQILSTVHDVTARSQAVLDAIERVLPFDAGMIRALDPERRANPALASRGLSDQALRYFDSAYDEIERLGLDQAPRAFRDLPIPADEIECWAEYLEPAGFREGVGVSLQTPDGRRLGFLALDAVSKGRPNNAGLTLIGMLAPLIATAIDPLRSIMAAARMVDDVVGGVVLTSSGTPLTLPGVQGHRLLDDGSPVLAVAIAQVTAGGVLTSFLVPDPLDPGRSGPRRRQPDAERYLRATVLTCAPTPPYPVAAAVVLSPTRDLLGLTPRELETLGLVVQGWSNQRISATLKITPRTVAAHIEHILDKLGAASRTVAAVRAFRQGLYVPHELVSLTDG